MQKLLLVYYYTRVTHFITRYSVGTRLQNEGNKEQGNYIYQYCFRFPPRATRIIEERFRSGNTLKEQRKYIVSRCARMKRLQNDRNDTLLSVPLEKHALEQGRYIWLSVTHG